jgi:hypothetical protein
VVGKYSEDFIVDAETTHVTWLLNAKAFQNGGYQEPDLTNANNAESIMGYQFYLKTLNVTQSLNQIAVETEIENTGNAPFYYPLTINLKCSNSDIAFTHNKYINGLLPGQTLTSYITLDSKLCTGALNFTSAIILKSDSLYEEVPVKFANKNDQASSTYGGVSFTVEADDF